MHDADLEMIRANQEQFESVLEKQRKISEKMATAAAEQESRLKKVKLGLLTAGLAAMITATVPVVSQIIGLGKGKGIDSGLPFVVSSERFADKKEFESLKISHEKMKDLLVAFDKRMDGSEIDIGSALALSALKSKLSELDGRLQAIEKSISDSPEKALSIPMLRKDQDSLAKAVESNRSVVATEIARINELQKWILGGIGTVLVAGIAALFTALFNVLSKDRRTS